MSSSVCVFIYIIPANKTHLTHFLSFFLPFFIVIYRWQGCATDFALRLKGIIFFLSVIQKSKESLNSFWSVARCWLSMDIFSSLPVASGTRKHVKTWWNLLIWEIYVPFTHNVNTQSIADFAKLDCCIKKQTAITTTAQSKQIKEKRNINEVCSIWTFIKRINFHCIFHSLLSNLKCNTCSSGRNEVKYEPS